jgi:hypothetical protein
MFDATNVYWSSRIFAMVVARTGEQPGPLMNLTIRMLGGVMNISQNLPIETVAIKQQVHAHAQTPALMHAHAHA